MVLKIGMGLMLLLGLACVFVPHRVLASRKALGLNKFDMAAGIHDSRYGPLIARIEGLLALCIVALWWFS